MNNFKQYNDFRIKTLEECFEKVAALGVKQNELFNAYNGKNYELNFTDIDQKDLGELANLVNKLLGLKKSKEINKLFMAYFLDDVKRQQIEQLL